MRVIVVGAGTVGTNIASHLTRDRHDLVVVDLSREKLRELEDHADVQTLVGNASDPSVLRQAIAGHETPLLLAVTDVDASNLIIGYVAKNLGIARVVARVRSRFYLQRNEVNFREPLGIDLLLSPEILTAQELSTFIEHPAALYSARLVQGDLELRTVMLAPFSEYASRRLKEIRFPPGLLIAALRRGKDVTIPTGDDELQAGDRVTLIGLPRVLDEIHSKFDTEQQIKSTSSARITIAGAGETGLFLAEILEAQGHKLTVIEQHRDRCELAGERLKRAIVLHGDCSNRQFLREEHIERTDYFVATTGDDETNVMSALLARELGVRKTACLIDRPDYVRIVEKVGIDVALSPRIIAANRVMTMVKQAKIRNVVLLEEGAVEVTEYQALAASAVVGEELKDLELPAGSLIGALIRNGVLLIPRGGDIIRPGDVVIAVAKAEAADELDAMFRKAN